MRRIRPKFESLFAEFEAQELQNPIHEAILVGVTDSIGSEEMQVIPNREGFFQVLCGFGDQTSFIPANDRSLEVALYERLLRAVENCPFSKPDKSIMLALLRNWADRELRGPHEV